MITLHGGGRKKKEGEKKRKTTRAHTHTHTHKMTSGVTWPTTNSGLVAMYSHAFSRFIKSVDFYKLQ
jgi:hypothetical protein